MRQLLLHADRRIFSRKWNTHTHTRASCKIKTNVSPPRTTCSTTCIEIINTLFLVRVCLQYICGLFACAACMPSLIPYCCNVFLWWVAFLGNRWVLNSSVSFLFIGDRVFFFFFKKLIINNWQEDGFKFHLVGDFFAWLFSVYCVKGFTSTWLQYCGRSHNSLEELRESCFKDSLFLTISLAWQKDFVESLRLCKTEFEWIFPPSVSIRVVHLKIKKCPFSCFFCLCVCIDVCHCVRTRFLCSLLLYNSVCVCEQAYVRVLRVSLC